MTFRPTGTGLRKANLLIVDSAADSPRTAALNGVGHATCSTISACGYTLLNQRAAEGASAFYVYKDADSGLNHGFPSGLFASSNSYLPQVVIDSGCIDSPTSPNGCSADPTSLDITRGTVLRIQLPPVNPGDFVGLNFIDPQDFGISVGTGYNLSPATELRFDVRSPDNATVQFGVGTCVTLPVLVGPVWSATTVPLNSLRNKDNLGLPCLPVLSNVQVLFTVVRTAGSSAYNILLDNIRFNPVPARQASDVKALNLPVGTATLGSLPAQALPIPTDQVNRNLATVRESSLHALTLFRRGQSLDIASALKIADAMEYALYHDNHGDPIPTARTNPAGCYSGAAATQCGLHSAYINGDIAFLNNQPAPAAGVAGDVRLAGFSSGTYLCGASGFCLVLDGASAGSNALAILTMVSAYEQSGAVHYLNDARTIANWIVANLADTSASAYGGYFTGYSDGGLPKQLITGKSTTDNALIFAAFSRLAQSEAKTGNAAAANLRTTQANAAGDFVMLMFDASAGRFLAGSATTDTGESLDHSDYLDSQTLTTLALSPSTRYRAAIDWTRPLQHSLAAFGQNIIEGGLSFSGLSLTTPSGGAPAGISWEHTAQAVAAMKSLSPTPFAAAAASYLAQLAVVQSSAQFGDGLGLVAASIQNGESLPPYSQCLATPYQCIPKRVSLAATTWAIFGDLGVNPVAPSPNLHIVKTHTGDFTQGQPGAYTLIVSDAVSAVPTGGMVTVTETVPTGMTLVSMAGTGWSCVGNTCTRNDVLAAGASYPPITVLVNVAANAPSQVTNQVSVSGGGSTGGNTGDVTNIVPSSCSFSLNPTTDEAPSSGGSGTFSVIATVGCPWTAFSGATWLHVTSGASGTGNGSVDYSVDANPNGTPRSGSIIAGGQSFTVTQAGIALRFVPITPCRAADTRVANGPFGGPILAAATPRDFNIPASACSIPANAVAYSLNMTVVPTGPLGYLTVWPTGLPQPFVSTLNSDGRIKGNAAIAPAGLNGAISVFVTSTTHLIIDINGYFVPAVGIQNLAFYPVTPCRIADTRGTVVPFGGPSLAPAVARDIPVRASPCGIPATAQAYSLNMTVVPPGVLGFLTTWPAGSPQPLVSTLNAPPGIVTANAAIVPAGVNGAISVFATQATDLVIDINGYFAPPGAAGSLDFFTSTPCRVLDTRLAVGALGGPIMGAGESRSFPVPSSTCGIPATAKAYSMNATVVPATILGFLTLWGDGAQPLAATLNAGDGAITGNAALVPAGAGGVVTAFTPQSSHLILDINGYFQ